MKKILLALPPFWAPLIPPTGLSSLKGFLQARGFRVKTYDFNIEAALNECSKKYFDTIKAQVPAEKQGNFYSIVNDVLRNHMMAHLQFREQEGRHNAGGNEYAALVNQLTAKTFFIDIDEAVIPALKEILNQFYQRLEARILEVLAGEEPDVLGLTVYSDTLPAAMFIFKLCREKYPHIRTVMGGGVFADLLEAGSPNMAAFLDKTRNYIDKIIIGEGEHLFLKWLKGELPEQQRVYTLADIQGRTLDLSSVEPLDLSDFDLSRYPYLVSYTSRSCPFQCNFCSETVQWGRYRKKSAGQVVRELNHLHQQYGSQLFLLSDSLLNPVIDDLAAELHQQERSLYWEGWLRADERVGDIENALSWRRAGFYHARIGTESGSPAVLEAMGKKITPQGIKNALFSLSSAGIKTSTLWIVGYPGETEEDFRQTLALVEKLKDTIYQAEGTPFWYFLTGQGNSDKWSQLYTPEELYPREISEKLVTRTWVLDCFPGREEVYSRLNRFINHLKKLGIPNTYSLRDIYEADERWQGLHKRAVPPLIRFKSNNKETINENKNIKNVSFAQHTLNKDMDFSF